jgi:hypothetical protein
MNHRRFSALCFGAVLPFMLCGLADSAAEKSEVKGAAIKVAVKHMGLAHDGKMDEATKLGTKELQDRWKSMPAKDRTMMLGMMKEVSPTEEQYSADIKSGGVLVVDGQSAKLTVTKKTQDKTGSSTSTTTQNFKLDGDQCLVNR